MRNRYYDPATGRFTQEDPIGLAGGLNLYGFAGGDPINFSDPFGLCPPELTGRPCLNMLGGRDLALRSDVPSGFGVIPERATGIHQGADYLSPVGGKVSAADAGTVDRVGYDPEGFGHYIQLAHKDSEGAVVSFTLYAHLNEAPTLAVGDPVAAGAAIGSTGQSGNAAGTPPHLHFEIRTRSYPGRGLGNRCDPVKAVGGEGGPCQ